MIAGDTPAGDGRFTARHIRMLGLLLLALICEGFDLQAMNLAAPALARDLGIPREELGLLLSASLVGVCIGAPLIGSLGDRLGRKRIIVGGSLSYGILSLAMAQVHSYEMLTLLRFLIGIGLGAVLPNVLAFVTEIAPRKQANVAALVVVGLPFGGTLGGVAATALIPHHGWESLFVLGGVVPILIALAIQVALPDLRAPAAAKPESRGVRALFAGQMRLLTPLIWLVFVAVLMTIYLLGAWIPLTLSGADLTDSQGTIAATGYHAGGMVGALLISTLLGKRNWVVIGSLIVGSCICLGILATGIASPFLLMTMVTLSGVLVVGTQTAMNGATGVTYPSDCRAAGLGWALGIGRLGSIAGPFVGSVAAGLGMTAAPHMLFMLPILPLALAAIAAFVVAARLRP